jgi:hypothetical protein
MRRVLSTLLMILIVVTSFAQQDFFTRELQTLSHISLLPKYRNGEMHQLSSYDRTGGNDDGFSGKYSSIRQEPGGLVIANLQGPGVINRIWTPTPTADTIKFYFDGETTPRIAVPFINLFTGKQFPFLSPLCGNELGGYYCYLPIPYERSLKIIYTGKNFRFHQIQYRSLTKEENVISFTEDMVKNSANELEQIAAVWNKKQLPLRDYKAKLKSRKVNLLVKSNAEQTLFALPQGGRIVGIELNAGTLTQLYRRLMISARWDNEPTKAIDAPLHDFFGYAFGRPSMQSILLGSDNRNFYSYLPMPFDRAAEIKIRYNKTKNDPDEAYVSGTVYYTEEKRQPATEGKLYVQSRRHYNIPSGLSHLISDVKGKGHYIGTILATQGLQEGSTWYFEGDDRATIDGKVRLHGTGSEDYFNGGWYAVIDRWDRRMSLPIHGCLEYDLMTSRTGGYRFYLSDKLNFSEAFQLTIEHQPDTQNNVKTDYTSLGFFYGEKPRYQNTSFLLKDTVQRVTYRDKLTPQGMVYSLYWLANASYENPSIVFSMKKSDEWFATIDPEAVPMAQIFLNGLDNGKYKLYVEYSMNNDSGPFSVWQRSGQVSDWMTGKDMPAAGGKFVYAGDITITDEVKTITLRKKSPTTAVRIFSFAFEKTDASALH